MRTQKFSEHSNGTQWEASEDYLQSHDTTPAVDWWYDGVGNYSYELGPLNYPETRSFSQVVWVASHKLGVGVARENGTVVVVAYYDPPGNQPNTTEAFKKNVLKPKTSENIFF